MTLVTIDLGDVAGGHDPDDHVIIRAEAFRESQGGGITSTAEVKIPLVNGVGQAEVEPGPVVVSFRCQAVADTREKRGVVPSSGTVGIERVLEGNLTYTPPVVDRVLEIVDGVIDGIKWERPAITSGTNLNLVLKSGSYSVPSYEVAETLTNRPQNTEAVDRAELRVFGSSSGIHQTWTPIRAAGLLSPIMHRRRDNLGTWTPWVRLDDISAESRATIMAEIGVAAWLKSALTGSENLNDLRTPGMYRVSTYAIANSLPNRPTLKTAINPAIIEVKSLATGQVEQVWTTLPAAGVDAPIMSRRRDNGGVWTPWERPGAKITLATGDDLNDFIDDGVLNVRTYGIANSLLNSPKAVSATSINRAVVTVTSAGGHTSQIWRSLPAADQESEMISRHRDSTGAWSEWSLGEEELVDGSTRSHQLHDRGLIRLAAQYSQDATPVWGWSAPPGEYLTIPTHEGSGQAIHPSVLYFPNGWNGWKYWMAHTPYPNFAEGHEDPNIVVSNDGTTWQVPAGLTNPLDDQTGRPSPHNSDTHLTMGPDGQMVMSWRMVNRPEGARNQFFWRTSTDGVTWTAKREIWAPPTSDYHSSTVSQSLTWMGDRWRMYFISSTPAPNQLVWVETTSKNPTATSWGTPVTCTFDFPIPRDRDFWHVETQLYNDQWIGIISDGNRGTTGTNGSIYLMRSSDGTAWEVSPVPLVPQVGDRHDSLYKTGFVVSGTGANMSLDVYYSAYDRTSRVWGTWRTKAVYVGGAPKAPLVTQSALDLRVPVGAIESLGQRIDAEKWARPLLRSGDTVNDKTGTISIGLHPVTAAVTGLPKATPGWVEVLYEANSNRTHQRFVPSSTTEYVEFTRIHSGGTWTEWEDVGARATLRSAKEYSDVGDTALGERIDAGDAALGQRIDAEKWRQRGLLSSDDLDDLRGSEAQGLYHVNNNTGGGTGKPGWVEVTYDSWSARTRQVFTPSSHTDALSLERKYSGGVWREWTPVTWHGVVVTSGSADDLIRPHAYAINSPSVGNLPVATLGSLQTLPSGSGATTLTQIFVSSETVPRMWTRTRRTSVWGQWVRWATHQDVEDIATHLIDEHRYVAPTMTMATRETSLSGGGGVIQSFSTDGKVGYNALTAELRQTLDEGATWQPVRTFGGNYTEWTRMLPNGELMVSTSGSVGGVSGRRVWVSAGYRPEAPTVATWEVVLTPAAPLVKFADWSISITDEMILLAEYGPKSGMVWGSGTDIIPEGQNARYVYQSLDNGKTWATIFDLNTFLTSNGRPNADRQHLHGVAWDKWWQRIWVSFGDASGDGTNGVLYSDDRGTTWKAAYWTHTHTSQGWQVVGIQPMKDCVLFAGDMTPSGVIRLDRAQGKNSFVFETGWDFSETDKHLCHVITYQDGPMGEIALFAFAREGNASPSFILGTRDGFTFEVLWQETGASLPGIRSVAGPSAQGTVIAAVNSSSGWSEVRGTITANEVPWAVGTLAVEKHIETHHPIGIGSPEGKVTATIGTQYTDQAATNGAIRWIKTTGTGTTGWRVQYGETGTRDVSDLIANASGELTIFRTGNVVFMDARGVTPTEDLSSGSTFISSMPSGFRPTLRRNFTLPSALSDGTLRSAFQFPTGAIGVWTPSPSDSYQLHLSWYTTDIWPTTLPGTPA